MLRVDQICGQHDIPKILWCSSKALKFPCTTAAISLIYWHRFCDYSNNDSIKEASESNDIVVCSSILFLAGKATEHIRRIREVMNVVRFLFAHRDDSFGIAEVSSTLIYLHFIFV